MVRFFIYIGGVEKGMAKDNFIIQKRSPTDIRVYKNGVQVGKTLANSPNDISITLDSDIHSGSGGSSAFLTYVHTQSVSSDTWHINHNLARQPVSVTVFDSSGQEVAFATIQVVDNNNITIGFNGAFSGTAYIL